VGHSKPASGRQVAQRPQDLTVRSPKVLVLGFVSCEGPKSRRDKGPLKGQLSCASTLRHIGCRELENQGFDIASRKAAREVRPRTWE
jgi:hypothetical protein